VIPQAFCYIEFKVSSKTKKDNKMPAETLHTTHQNVQPDERDVAAKLKAQYEKAQFDADQKEAFGKYDVTAPNEGEDTYQSYLDQRPAEGIVHNGDVYQNAQTGKFASEQAYNAQNGDTQAYYDQLGGIEEKQEVYEGPNYEAMGVMQLAKEAAKAQQLGDRAEEATIREALEQHLTIDALNPKDDAESPEEAQKRYDAEVARYEDLIKKFGGAEDTVTSVESAPKPELARQLESAEQSTPSVEKENTDPDIFLNGEKVIIDNVFQSPDGQKAVLVKDAAGATQLVFEKELTYTDKSVDAEPSKVEVPVDESRVETEAAHPTPGKEVERFIGKEVERYDPDLYKLKRAEQETTAKKWWEKARDGVRKRAGVAYWAAQWETYVITPVREKWSKVLEYGVTDEMTDAEKEKRRKDNRIAVIIAGAGIVALGAGIIIESGIAAFNAHQGGDMTGNDLGNGAGGGGHTVESFAPTEDATLSVGDGDHDALFSPETSVPIAANSGDGGEALFQRYDIPIDKWYNNARTLLAQFPQDFYLKGNDVRIAHTGPLSQGAQDFINSLR
jgi:hypothetical protein